MSLQTKSVRFWITTNKKAKFMQNQFEIEAFSPVKSGCLIGYLDILDVKRKWIYKDFRLFEKNGTQWVTPPQREYKNKEGEIRYINLIQMEQPERNALSMQLVDAYQRFQNKDKLHEPVSEQEIEENVESFFENLDEEIPF